MIWHNSEPYYEYICTNGSCPRDTQLWRNQDGDPNCQQCGKPRSFQGHFAPNSKKRPGWRWRIDTESWERSPSTRHSAEAFYVGLRGLGDE